MGFVERGKTALAEICVDGCGGVSKSSGSHVTNWLDLSNRWPCSQLAMNSKHNKPNFNTEGIFILKCRYSVNKISPKQIYMYNYTILFFPEK